MLGLILGVFVIILGAKAFTASGIPFTREKNITGTPAYIIGGIVVLFGLALVVSGALSSLRLISLFSQG